MVDWLVVYPEYLLAPASAARAPVPTLHLAYAALQRKRLLKMWLAKYGEKHVWQFLRYRTAFERVVE